MSRSEVNLPGLIEAIQKVGSLEAVNKQLVKFSLPPVADLATAASHAARASGIKNHGDVTVLMLNVTDGKIDYDYMTAVLKAVFPGAKVKDRHGPHYISQVRTGKIAGLDPGVVVPAKQRGVKAKAGSTPKAVTTAAPVQAKVSAPAVAAPVQAKVSTPVAPVSPPTPAVDVAALREKLTALPMKDIVAQAKAAGIKAVGKKETLIEALIAVA